MLTLAGMMFARVHNFPCHTGTQIPQRETFCVCRWHCHRHKHSPGTLGKPTPGPRVNLHTGFPKIKKNRKQMSATQSTPLRDQPVLAEISSAKIGMPSKFCVLCRKKPLGDTCTKSWCSSASNWKLGHSFLNDLWFLADFRGQRSRARVDKEAHNSSALSRGHG